MYGQYFLVRFWETPPLAWGRRGNHCTIMLTSRNTPTGVGKTLHTTNEPVNFWKHPHWRGEDRRQCQLRARRPETPPLAWGRPAEVEAPTDRQRNTPTGVGKTPIYCKRTTYVTSMLWLELTQRFEYQLQTRYFCLLLFGGTDNANAVSRRCR